MDLNILGTEDSQISLDEDFLLISRLVDEADGHLEGLVNLVFCDDDTIQQLNKQYRHKDKVTDVLTFTYYEGETQPDELLGEVVISVPQTKRQAPDQEWDDFADFSLAAAFEMELYKLFIHGLLHMRGYDHEVDEDYRVMKLLEDKIMKSFLSSRKI